MRHILLSLTALSLACDTNLMGQLEADLASRDAEIVELAAEVENLERALAERPTTMPIMPPPGVNLRPVELVPGEIRVREQGPPAGIYITSYNAAAIFRATFATIVLSPGAKAPNPAQTCTLSWYQPDLSKDEMVLGLGCSMLAPSKLWDNYRATFVANNGVQF